MKRRKFIKTVTASAATGFGLNLIGNSCSMNKNQPNILLIHTDQHRIECLGSYGNKDVQTPNIDSIANREFVFAHNWKGAGAMARSKNRKLLFHPTRKSLFFDLEKDPNELVDVYSITSKVFVFCAKEFYYP
ncbi:hypothetical protein H8E88_02045, partial [candidate division KSB1 bacterium]|nr:hypothetical protein [candidate division KSB1 bacterium]